MPGPHPRARTRGDLTLLDPLRLFANFLVVWRHMRGTDLFGVRIGVYVFLLIMFGLATGRSKPERLRDFARRKAKFLLVPWLRWSLIYVAVAVVARWRTGRPAAAAFDPWQLLAGGHPALWFLPMAAVAIVVAKLIQIGADRLPPALAMVGASLLAVATTRLASAVDCRFAPVFPLESWVRCAPLIFWGVAIGQSRRIEPVARRRAALAAVVTVAACAVAVDRWWIPSPPMPGDLVAGSAIAVALVAVGFGFQPRVPPIVHRLASLTYGIYLVHPLVAKVAATAFAVFSWPIVVHVFVVWIASGLLIFTLRRLGLRWTECLDLRAPSL
jgi:surface polysaccharide O-acyltransferase-like enzyme